MCKVGSSTGGITVNSPTGIEKSEPESTKPKGTLNNKSVTLTAKGQLETMFDDRTEGGQRKHRAIVHGSFAPPDKSVERTQQRLELAKAHLTKAAEALDQLYGTQVLKLVKAIYDGDPSKVSKYDGQLQQLGKLHLSQVDRTILNTPPEVAVVLDSVLFYYGTEDKLKAMMEGGNQKTAPNQLPTGPYEGSFPQGIYGTTIPPWRDDTSKQQLMEALFSKGYTESAKPPLTQVSHCMSFVAEPWNWQAMGTYKYRELEGMSVQGSTTTLQTKDGEVSIRDEVSTNIPSKTPDEYRGGTTWHWAKLVVRTDGLRSEKRATSLTDPPMRVSTQMAELKSSPLDNPLFLGTRDKEGRAITIRVTAGKDGLPQTDVLGPKGYEPLTGESNTINSYFVKTEEGLVPFFLTRDDTGRPVSFKVGDSEAPMLMRLQPIHLGENLMSDRMRVRTTDEMPKTWQQSKL